MTAIVFERIRRRHLFRIIRLGYLSRRELYYLDTDVSVSKLVGRLEGSGRLKAVTLKEPVYFSANPAADRAFAETDRVYEETVPAGWLGNRLAGLYASDKIHLAFKKNLLFYYQSRFYRDLLAERAREAIGEKEIKFVDSDSAPLWLEIREKLKTAVIVGQTLIAATLSLLFRQPGAEKIEREFAIAVISPDREFANPIRGVDFLLDNKRVRRDNTIFVPLASLSAEQVEYLKERGLALGDMGTPGTLKTYLSLVGTSVAVLASLAVYQDWACRAGAYLARDYWLWSGFLRRYDLKDFVTYADFGIRHVGRNVLLNKAGVRTWYYTDTVNTGDGVTPKDQVPYRHQFWGYLLYDNLVCWSERNVRWWNQHQPSIGRFHVLGCFWSEHVRLIKEGKIASGLASRLREAGHKPGQKVVAVFDSTYNNASLTTYEAGVAFLRGVEKLLEADPDLFVVWKEKKNRALRQASNLTSGIHGSYGIEAEYERLAGHPRVFFTGHRFNASEVIAIADVTVSFPFTSTTLEALGAGAKAIYFDPTRKYESAYYSSISGLVAFGSEELIARVQELIYRTDDKAYQAYLEDRIKGEIEPFLDGMALTRFRRLLAAEAAGDTPGARTSTIDLRS